MLHRPFIKQLQSVNWNFTFYSWWLLSSVAVFCPFKMRTYIGLNNHQSQLLSNLFFLKNITSAAEAESHQRSSPSLRARKRRSVLTAWFTLDRRARPSTTWEVCFIIPRGPPPLPPHASSPSSIPSSDLNVGMVRGGWGNTRQSRHGAAYINPPVQMSCQTIAANQNFCSYNWPSPRLNKN